jgi:NADH-quinone oxidoreductase subunit A
MNPYYPIFLIFIIAVLVGLIMIYVGIFVRPSKPNKSLLDVYECGVPAFGDARKRYNARFYIIAMLFVIFDVETVFLFPWAVAFDVIGIFGLIEMILFIVILVFGYFYAWKKGALEWV